jgi:taurine dioxygenase
MGAEILSLDLSQPLDPETFAELDAALLEWKVIVAKGQRLSREQMLALAQRWGTVIEDSLPRQVANGGAIRPMDNPVDNIVLFTRDDEAPGLENIWHVDGSYRPAPMLGTMLLAMEVPPVGGDTMFADMAAAYDNLEPAVAEAIGSLRAVHDWSSGGYAHKYAADLATYRQAVPAVLHPLVLPHPRTGRRTLFANRGFTSRIPGLGQAAGDALLDLLTRQADTPEYQFRLHWEPGTFVFWDNFAVQHYAVNDFWPQRRTMMRATVEGGWTTGVAAPAGDGAATS